MKTELTKLLFLMLLPVSIGLVSFGASYLACKTPFPTEHEVQKIETALHRASGNIPRK